MCEMLLQGLKQEEQIHYSPGTENCLRELADAGSSTSISFSSAVMRTSATVDMRVERLRRPEEPGGAANQCSMISKANGGNPPRFYTRSDRSHPPRKEPTKFPFLRPKERKN